MNPPLIAIAGSTGQVARALQRETVRRGLTAPAVGRPHLDLTDTAGIARFLDETAAKVVINAAAYTAVDKAESEPDEAQAVNAHGAAHLASACAARGIALIHISTDYVFDGTKSTPYVEGDAIHPLSVYGHTKADGEDAVRRLNPMHVIARTSWVYGPDGANFLKTMLRLAADRDEIGVVADQHGAPTRADDLASALIDIALALDHDGDDVRYGTYHVAGGGATTWAGFAEAIFAEAQAAGLKGARVRPISTAEYKTAATRPAYSVLDQSKLAAAFSIRMPDWRTSLARHFVAINPATSPMRPTP